MYKGKTFFAVITARGGSKGVPRKNIKLLGGKPLIGYTIDAVKNSAYVDAFVVSTEDSEIADVSKQCGAPVPFMRPAELATDKAKSMPVIQHAVEWVKNNEGKEFDYIITLQPTSPFSTAKDLDKGIELVVEKNADSVTSMYPLVGFALPKLKRIDETGRIFSYVDEYPEGKESVSRQELPPMYKRNGAYYITKASLIKEGDLFGEKSYAHIMPEHQSVDINTMFDWYVAEALLKHQS